VRFENLPSLRSLHLIIGCYFENLEHSIEAKIITTKDLFHRPTLKLVTGAEGCRTALATREVHLYGTYTDT